MADSALLTAALAQTLVFEGGYSDHPDDPGGVTLQGITQRVDDAFRRNSRLPPRALTVSMIKDPLWTAERDAIYKLQYWDAIHGDELPPGVGMAVFDGAVNSGVRQALKWLQKSLSTYSGAIDGVFGEATRAALRADLDNDALCARICAARFAFMKALRTWKTFKRGWTSRVQQILKAAQRVASGSVASPPSFLAGMQARADVTDAALPAFAIAAPTAGAGGAGVTATLASLKDQLDPLTMAVPQISYVVAGIAIVSAGIGLVGFGYGAWAARKRKAVLAAIDSDVVPAPAPAPAA